LVLLSHIKHCRFFFLLLFQKFALLIDDFSSFFDLEEIVLFHYLNEGITYKLYLRIWIFDQSGNNNTMLYLLFSSEEINHSGKVFDKSSLYSKIFVSVEI